MHIAVTGGIGSGKSLLVKHLRDFLPDYRFHDVDEIVRSLYTDTFILGELQRKFKTVSRTEISDLVFANPEHLKWIEELFVPYVAKELEHVFCDPNVVVEFPLLFEMKYDDKFDLIVGVVADADVRVNRALSRSVVGGGNVTPAKVANIMSRQADPDDVKRDSQVIVDTTHNPDMAIEAERVSMEILGKTRGIVAGSFDPITEGHLWLIERAQDIVDVVDVVVAVNPTKKSFFSFEQRVALVKSAIAETLLHSAQIRISQLPYEKILVKYARETGAAFIFRGIRNVTDFDYETQLNLVQKAIEPGVETLFLMPPRHLTEVSSSLVKSMVHLNGWEDAARPYVSESVLAALVRKNREGGPKP